jgi:signal peptidase II
VSRISAVFAIAIAFVLDFASKRLFAGHPDWNEQTWLPGLLDTHYAWNRGVSFSLFWQDGDLGSRVLAALLFLVTLIFAVAAFRTAKPLLAAAMGLIVGGALGNMADRALHGAVFDFLVVRLGVHPFFVCNVADIFISLGVLLFFADTLLAPQKQPA